MLWRPFSLRERGLGGEVGGMRKISRWLTDQMKARRPLVVGALILMLIVVMVGGGVAGS